MKFCNCRRILDIYSQSLLNKWVMLKLIYHQLRWLDWIFLGGYLPSLSINYVSISKDMGKRLPPVSVSSNMANDSFNLFVSSFVSFSINGLKENAENLNYCPILRRKVALYLFLSTHREWESFPYRLLQMLSTAATIKEWIKVSVVYLQCSLPC